MSNIVDIQDSGFIESISTLYIDLCTFYRLFYFQCKHCILHLKSFKIQDYKNNVIMFTNLQFFPEIFTTLENSVSIFGYHSPLYVQRHAEFYLPLWDPGS